MNFELVKSTVEGECQKLGISEYEIYFESESSTGVEMLKDEISGFSSSSKAGVCIRLQNDGKMGYASGELFTEFEISELVLRAIENAKNTEKEDTVGIFEGSKEYITLKNGNDFSILETDEIKRLSREMQTLVYQTSDKVIDGTQS